jgi:ribosomal protein S18 acetylase RimI-like enzyme
MSGVTIRQFGMGDYETVLRLWQEADIPCRPAGRDGRESLELELAWGAALFLVAEDEGVVVGAVLGTHDGRKGWVNRLVVAPEYRGGGLARRLVQEVEEALAARGIEIVACLIETPNIGSMDFFEKLGYLRGDDIVYYSKRQRPES